jgi:hypothetical protein
MDQTLKEKLIARFHLEQYPPEDQEELLSDAGLVIMNGVASRAIPLIPDEYASEYDAMIAKDADIIQIFSFLKEKVPGFQEIVDEEIGLLEKTLG